MEKKYTIQSITKEKNGFIVSVNFGEKVGERNWLFSRDLKKSELVNEIELSCKGVLRDERMFEMNKERDLREAQDDKKLEEVKKNLGIK